MPTLGSEPKGQKFFASFFKKGSLFLFFFEKKNQETFAALVPNPRVALCAAVR
jgi:hypothetical protein